MNHKDTKKSEAVHCIYMAFIYLRKSVSSADKPLIFVPSVLSVSLWLPFSSLLGVLESWWFDLLISIR